MSQWKATMPKQMPKSGQVQMVVAARSETGSRAEFVCEVSAMKSKLIIKLMAMTDKQIIDELKGGAA